MSFTSESHRGDSSFEIVMQSLLQDEVLPFSDALTVSPPKDSPYASDAGGI